MMTAGFDSQKYQLTFLRPAQMSLFATVLVDPPLGQATIIPYHQNEIKFTVLIESSISFSEQPWKAVVWHNCHENRQWDGLDLTEIEDSSHSLAISSKDRPNVYRRYYTGVIAKPATTSDVIEFTLKYKTTDGAWTWVNDTNYANGEIYFQSPKLPERLEDCFENFGPDFAIQPAKSDCPDTKLWELTIPLQAAGKKSAFSENFLGIPLHIARWFALVRIWTPWLAPRHGKTQFSPTEDSILCSFLRRDGLHLVLVAVSGVADTQILFKHDDKGGVVVSSRNDGAEPDEARIIAAIGHSHGTALAACMYHARKAVFGEMKSTGELQAEIEGAQNGGQLLKNLSPDGKGPVDANWFSEWYDGLTYCTWNGLGQKLTEQKIFDALDDLDKNNIKITNLIIDDNWQSLDNPGEFQDGRGMVDFDANEEGFPKGLEYTVRTLRQNHPGIEHVAVWHAMLGYWGGISPQGSISKKYKTKVVRRTDKGRVSAGQMTVVADEDVERFYDDFYEFLAGCGVDGVKTDAQFFLDLLEDPVDRRTLTKRYQDSWTVSGLKWFSTRAISCMSLVPQIIFHSQLPTNKPRLMVRNSDDFFPEIPSSHPWHLFTNAFTSLFTQHLNVLPDWDMFQTSHEYSSFHAAARCVSGGPIYITDEPGRHDLNLINQMTAPNHRFDSVILRPSTLGKTVPSGVYTAYEEERFLKIGTYHGHQGTGAGIIGVFNVSPRALSELVMLHEFPGVENGHEYVIRAHTTGEITNPIKTSCELPLVSLFLDVKGWEILAAYPLITVDSTLVAPLGLLGKMSGAAAMIRSSVNKTDNGRIRIHAVVKALGTLGFFISSLPQKTVAKDLMATLSGRAIPENLVSIAGSVLSIDILGAWKEMQIHPGWGSDIILELFIS